MIQNKHEITIAFYNRKHRHKIQESLFEKRFWTRFHFTK